MLLIISITKFGDLWIRYVTYSFDKTDNFLTRQTTNSFSGSEN